MHTGFDIDRTSHLLAVREVNQKGELRVLVYDLRDRRILSQIDNSLIPGQFEISPNGNYLVLGSNLGRIYLHDIEGGRTDIFFHDPMLQAGFPVWSPDGEQVVFSAYGTTKDNPIPPHILSVDIESRKVTRLTGDSSYGDRFPRWSPCGRKLAFMRQHIEESGMPGWVCVVDMGMKEAKLLPRPGDAYCRPHKHCWSPDSSQMLITCDDGNSTWLHVIRIEDAEIIWSSCTDELCVGAFSPCDNNIVVATPSELSLVSIPDGEILHRLPIRDFGALKKSMCGGEIGFSDGGRSVYFLTEDSCIHRWDTKSGCTSVLSSKPDQQIQYDYSVYSIIARDGRTIPVHRFTPPDAKSIAFEMVIGGPGGMVSASDQSILGLVAAGFEVIAPAYRGCNGHGAEHLNANIGQYGGADMLDVVDCGLDWVERTGGNRPLALVGYSHGGYLTLLALAQANAPWTCGTALWSTTEPYGVHMQKWYPSDPTEKAKAEIERSPMAQASKIRLPLLILHGALDTFSVENLRIIHDHVSKQGVHSEIIVFEDDTHALHLHYDEVMERICEFAQRYTAESG
jgi:dipeptidyl aminopeptidase/acylaminoacyl peptidase